MPRLAVLFVLLAACDSAPDRALPGPCSARTGDHTRADYGYDDADRLVTLAYESRDPESGDGNDDDVTWTWAADGTLASVHQSLVGSVAFGEQTWTFDATGASRVAEEDTFTGTERYEPGLTFLGDPFDDHTVLRPEAPDALVRSEPDGGIPVDYTYDGPPHQGTRTRTGSDGTVVAFAYDADGHLVEGDGVSYVYDDGALAEVHAEFSDKLLEHDEFGNLLQVRATYSDGAAFVTTYDYGCW